MYFWFSFRRLGKFLDNMRTYTITRPMRDSQKISVVTIDDNQNEHRNRQKSVEGIVAVSSCHKLVQSISHETVLQTVIIITVDFTIVFEQ